MDDTIKFRPPDKRTPGFWRRTRTALQFYEMFGKGMGESSIDLSVMDDLMEFLLDYVYEPSDRNKARELMFELSEEDFMSMLGAVMGRTAETVPLPK